MKIAIIALIALPLFGCQSQDSSGWPEPKSCEEVYQNISEHVCDGTGMSYREYKKEFGE
jgi:hypothetical protein